MTEYHKIPTVFERDPETKFKGLIEGKYAAPELAYLADNQWMFTEKVDGTNIRVKVNPRWTIDSGPAPYSTVEFGGRTDDAQIPAKLVNRLSELFGTTETAGKLAEMFPDGATLYGEGFGDGIQKVGKLYAGAQDFVLFDVRVGIFWLERHNVADIAAKLGLQAVPIIGFGTLPEMVAMAKRGIDSVWGAFPAEGIVARPAVEMLNRAGQRVITKIKTKDFQVAK